jgi:mitochondrial fission protein ELM1
MPEAKYAKAFQTWIVSTEKAGHINQCRALMSALGIEPDRTIQIPGKSAAETITQQLAVGMKHVGLTSKHILTVALPERLLVVASGQSALLYCRYLRKRLGKRLLMIMVGVPKSRIDYADILIGSILKRTMIDEEWMPVHRFFIEGSLAFKHQVPVNIAQEEKTIAALIGGKNTAFNYNGAQFDVFKLHLTALVKEQGARLIVVFSRRTMPETVAALRNSLDQLAEFVEVTDRQGYLDALARASRFVVCPDSVSMICECCSSGKTVFVPTFDISNKRHHSIGFIDYFLIQKYILPLGSFSWEARSRYLANQAETISTEIKVAIREWAI